MDNFEPAKFASGIVRAHLTIWVGFAEQARQALETVRLMASAPRHNVAELNCPVNATTFYGQFAHRSHDPQRFSFGFSANSISVKVTEKG